MSFWRIAAKMSPSKSCTRSGIRGVNGGQSRSLPPGPGQLGEVGHADQPRDLDHLVVADPERLHDRAPQVGRRVGGHRQLDHLAAPPPLQRRLELAHQVLGLLLDLEVAVAQHPEGAVPEHRVAGEELAEEHLEQRLERQEADLPLRPLRQPHEARHLRRHRQQRLEHGVVRLAPELQPHGEAAVGDERERMRRVDGERRQDREHLLEEVRLHQP